MKLTKKGFSITEVPMLVVTFGVIALVISMMATVLVNFKDQPSNVGSASRTDSNTVTITNVASFYADYDVKGNLPLSCSGVSVFNGTNAVNMTSAVTLSGTGNCYAVVNSTYNNTAQQFNYTETFVTYSMSYNISQDGLVAQNVLAGWQQTWVVIVASAVVLGIISAYLFFKAKE